MRKILLSFTLLCMCAISLNAQKLQSSRVTTLKQQQVNTAATQEKIDPQLLSDAKAKSSFVNLAPANKIASADARITVDIKCSDNTASVVGLIASAGGDVVNSSSANNIIIAKIPANVLQKIAASDDVKFISKSTATANFSSATTAKKPFIPAASQSVVKPIATGSSIRLAQGAADAQAKH